MKFARNQNLKPKSAHKFLCALFLYTFFKIVVAKSVYNVYTVYIVYI